MEGLVLAAHQHRVTETVEAFGCVDLLVNAAAVRRFAPLRTADADGVFDVNVLAPLRLPPSRPRR